jgi:hypothetical protein
MDKVAASGRFLADASADEYVDVDVQLPFDILDGVVDNSLKFTIQPRIVWNKSTDADGDVVLNVGYYHHAIDGVEDSSLSTPESITYDGSVDDDMKLRRTSFTAIEFAQSAVAAGDILTFRFTRDADNAADTYAADVEVFGFEFEIRTI